MIKTILLDVELCKLNFRISICIDHLNAIDLEKKIAQHRWASRHQNQRTKTKELLLREVLMG